MIQTTDRPTAKAVIHSALRRMLLRLFFFTTASTARRATSALFSETVLPMRPAKAIRASTTSPGHDSDGSGGT